MVQIENVHPQYYTRLKPFGISIDVPSTHGNLFCHKSVTTCLYGAMTSCCGVTTNL